MKYGITFSIDVYDFDQETGETIVTRPSDYLAMQRWTDRQKGLAGDLANLYGNYALLWYALEREDKLSRYGASGDAPTMQSIDELAKHVSVYVEIAEKDSLPTSAR